MLRWRLLLGTVFVALVAALGWADMHAPRPGLWLFPLAVVVAIAASGELLWMSRNREARPLAWVVYAGNLFIVVSNWLPYVTGDSHRSDVWAFPALAFALGLGLAFAGEMYQYRKPGGVSERIAMAVLAQAYVGLLLSFVIQLRFLQGGTWGIPALASLIIVVKMGDIGAYTVGRLIGRHRMAPVLSPGKTWEGAVGGIVFACVGAWLALDCLLPAIVPVGSRPQPIALGWLWFGVLVGAAGMLGDLAESLLKTRSGMQGFQPLDAGLRRRTGHSRFDSAGRAGRLWLLGLGRICVVTCVAVIVLRIPSKLAGPGGRGRGRISKFRRVAFPTTLVAGCSPTVNLTSEANISVVDSKALLSLVWASRSASSANPRRVVGQDLRSRRPDSHRRRAGRRRPGDPGHRAAHANGQPPGCGGSRRSFAGFGDRQRKAVGGRIPAHRGAQRRPQDHAPHGRAGPLLAGDRRSRPGVLLRARPGPAKLIWPWPWPFRP